MKVKYIMRIISIIFLSVILSGSTILSYGRIPRIYMMLIVSIFTLLMSSKKHFKINKLSFQWFLWCVFLLVSSLFSYDKDISLQYGLIFLSFLSLSFISFNCNELSFIFKVIRFVCLIFCFSILISLIIPDLFSNYLNFLLANSKTIIAREISFGQYSGLVGEKSNAAYYLNIGLALELSFFAKNRKLKSKNIIYIILYIIAIMLTGKRMLFAIALVCLLLFILLFNIKGKASKTFIYLLIISPVLLLILNSIPQTSHIVTRFLESQNDLTFNGRRMFWDVCIMMFKERPFLGFGFGSFNLFLQNRIHYIYEGTLWNMFAHNIYYELLGEIGIIGLTAFIYLSLNLLVKTFKLFKSIMVGNESKQFLFFSILVQVVFILYGFTGNVIYNHFELGFYMFCIAIYNIILKKEGCFKYEK